MTDPHTDTDFVDETLVKQFEAAWAEGRAVPIEQFLPSGTDEKQLATLEELVHVELELAWERCSELRHSAPTVSESESLASPPRVEAYLERFPQLNRSETILRLLRQECLVRKECGDAPTIAEYHDRFPELVAADWEIDTFIRGGNRGETILFAADTRAFDRSVDNPPEAPLPRQFGNYEILDELGRGGMGVVYRARQQTADRIVALKVVRSDLLQSLARGTNASPLDRFNHEIQAAARLEHENIVSVHEVGHVDGEPFFSMQYVDGRSLVDILRDGPLSSRDAARYMEPVARAVHEAHEAGILHRDLKPQNILVDSQFDRPLVADFGLAKLQESDEQLTQTGDIMGSPPYMSPEQAQDSSNVTALSDVYALGATLYHLITWAPPFRAANGWETLRQVMDRDPVPPRQLNPSIDKDLETICLKCLEKEPSSRYVSALALAEDLRRYLNDEPIRALPIGPWGRAVRWCRRKPVVAGLIASTATALVLALVATLVGYVRTTAALNTAETGYRHARQVVNEFYTRVSEDTLLNQPGMQPLRQDLLRQALDYYQQFLLERGDDPSIQDELAMAHFRIGRITEQIDSPDTALTSYRQALDLQRRLVSRRPDDRGLLTEFADTWTAVGNVLLSQREFDDARAAHRQAADIRRRLLTEDSEDAECRRTLASTHMNLGLVDMESGRFEDADTNFSAAQALRRSVLDKHPDCIKTRRDLGMGYYNLANLCLSRDERDFEGAETNFQRAASLFDELLGEEHRDLANQYRLAVCCRRLADVQCVMDKAESARGFYQRSFEQMEKLADRNPDVPDYLADLAGLHMNLGQLDAEDGDRDEAVQSFRQAAEILDKLLRLYPDVVRYRRDLAVTHQVIGTLELNVQKAREQLQTARDHLRELSEKYPDNDEYRELLEATERKLQDLDEANEP